MKTTKITAACGFSMALVTMLSEGAVAQVTPDGSIFPAVVTQTVNAKPAAYDNNLKVNFVRTWQADRPFTAEADVVSTSRTTAEVKQTTQYFDGLGRPLQSVAKQVTPGTSPKDVVTAIVYDEFGREEYKYLPYASSTNTGKFKLDPFAEQENALKAIYNPANSTNGEKFFYSKTKFEASPLSRTLKALAPGNSWAGNDRGVSMSYEINVASEVRIWNIAAAIGSIPASPGFYDPGELYRTVTTDEHAKRVVEYKDKEEHVILKKVEIKHNGAATITSHTGWLCTYYVYDDLGSLRFVIPPKAVEAIQSNWSFANRSTVIDELCFRYEYDERRRMSIKKVPGAGEVHMVYDARDRLVMTKDANMGSSQWMVTKYDALNRPTTTYLWNNSGSRTTHQTSASASTAYPTLSGTYQLLTETYYDDYTWSSGINGISSTVNTNYSGMFTSYNTSPHYAQQIQKSGAVKGLVTGSKVNVLGSSSHYLYVLTLYDDKARPVQTLSINYTGGVDIVSTQYDFAGKVLRSHHYHTNPNMDFAEFRLLTKIDYDHAGRLLEIRKKLNDDDEKVIAINEYDAFGQLKTKKLGTDPNTSEPLEILDYSYNIRGWLTGINRGYANPLHATEASAQANRWFGMQLSYDHGFTSTEFNGNIAGIIWKSTGSDKERAYGFQYDRANRLLKADFTQKNSGWNVTDGIDFSMRIGDGVTPSTAYDGNGNIQAMWQKGLKIQNSDVIDDMTYHYQLNSNKLDGVTEANGDEDHKLGDFVDRHSSDVDYLYDNNGNLRFDLNKNIEDIQYNHLNLPREILLLTDDQQYDKGRITYVYDATGNKLSKIVYEPASGQNSETEKTVTTTYLNGFVYESSSVYRNGQDPIENSERLQFIGH
jgi:hypothetical protein